MTRDDSTVAIPRDASICRIEDLEGRLPPGGIWPWIDADDARRASHAARLYRDDVPAECDPDTLTDVIKELDIGARSEGDQTQYVLTEEAAYLLTAAVGTHVEELRERETASDLDGYERTYFRLRGQMGGAHIYEVDPDPNNETLVGASEALNESVREMFHAIIETRLGCAVVGGYLGLCVGWIASDALVYLTGLESASLVWWAVFFGVFVIAGALAGLYEGGRRGLFGGGEPHGG